MLFLFTSLCEKEKLIKLFVAPLLLNTLANNNMKQMESFNSHKLKPEKAKKNQKYHRQLRKIAELFRYVEMCVVLVLISRLSFQLPMAVKNTSEYLHAFVSPSLVFLIGNLIIIALFAQFGQFSATTDPQSDLYREFLHNSFMNHKVQAYEDSLSIKGERINGCPEKQSREKQNMVKQNREKQSREKQSTVKQSNEEHSTEELSMVKQNSEKQSTVKQSNEEQSKGKESSETGDITKRAEKHITKTITSLEMKDYRRCKSDVVREVESEEPPRVLRRCETENKERSSYPEDGMSSDEFRRAVEAFIARQQRNLTQDLCFTH